ESQDFMSSSFLMVPPVSLTCWAFGSSSFAAAGRALPNRVGRASQRLFHSLSFVVSSVARTSSVLPTATWGTPLNWYSATRACCWSGFTFLHVAELPSVLFPSWSSTLQRA